MMFVVKGVVNLSDSTKGELAIVSYQSTQGDHRMSFFYNREEVFSDFTLSFGEVISKLDKRPNEIVVADRKAYLRVVEDELELVDLHLYSKSDKELTATMKIHPTEAVLTKQVVSVHKYKLPDLETAVRAKSHMKQYQMKGLTLAMKLAWENPIKYDEVDIFPVDNYYADFEAMTDVVYLDYTIQDYTQQVKSVEELVDQVAIDEEEYLQDDELEEIIEEYEEESIDDDYEEEEDEEEVEIELPTRKIIQKAPQVKEEPKKKQANTQPRDKNGKFISNKKKKNNK